MTEFDGTTTVAADPAEATVSPAHDKAAETPDPARQRLLAAVHSLRDAAGNPTIRQVSEGTDPQVSRTTVSRLLSGEAVPSRLRFTAILVYLGASRSDAEQIWNAAHPDDPDAGSGTDQRHEGAAATAEPDKAIPPLIGKKGVSELLGVAVGTVRDWHNHAQGRREAQESTWRDLPEPDRAEDGKELWFPVTIINWAVRTARLPRVHGLTIPALPGPLWSLTDIADHFGVDVDHTVRERWRWHYVRAIRRKQPPPPGALPAETLNAEGAPLWDPPVILAWGVKQGKLDRATFEPFDREGQHWRAPEQPPAPPTPAAPDPVQERLDRGEIFDAAAIAVFFKVKESTVRMWRSPHGSGKGFPAPDAGRTRSGQDAWEKPTIYEWGEGSHRIEDGNAVAATGGRPSWVTDPP